jgi:hypothetical protein
MSKLVVNTFSTLAVVMQAPRGPEADPTEASRTAAGRLTTGTKP